MASSKALQKALKKEVKEAMERWGSEIKVSAGKGKSKFPIYVRRCVPQPPSASDFDLADLSVRLYVNGLDVSETPVSVRVTTKLPPALTAAIEANVKSAWEATLQATAGQAQWHLVTMLKWVEDSWRQLVGLVPACLDTYLGVDASGATARRIAIVEPAEEEKKLTEEEAEALAAKKAKEEAEARAYWEAKREARIEKELLKREAEAAEKRAMAEAGLLDDPKPAKLSKKQLKAIAEDKKLRKGRRLAKTGPRRRKYVAPEDRPAMPADD